MLEKAFALRWHERRSSSASMSAASVGSVLAQRREPSNALVDGELQSAIEKRTDSVPAVLVNGT